MSKVLVEMLGTFFLVLVIGLTVLPPGAGAMAPLAIGAILMVMVYAGGPVSGAHYNPAVTLAVFFRGACGKNDVLPYIAAQLVGAVLAATLVGFLTGGSEGDALRPAVLPACVVEFVFTFALAYVVLTVATTKQSAGNSYFGLAIGSTVMAAAYAGGPISGGAFNPAVALGATLMGLMAPSILWIICIATLAGGACAALVFRATHAER